ncbi:DUF6893 family small protein [Streptomyces sp. NPDC058734]
MKKAIAFTMAAVFGAVVVTMLPDLKRYLRISRM